MRGHGPRAAAPCGTATGTQRSRSGLRLDVRAQVRLPKPDKRRWAHEQASQTAPSLGPSLTPGVLGLSLYSPGGKALTKPAAGEAGEAQTWSGARIMCAFPWHCRLKSSSDAVTTECMDCCRR